MSNDRQVALITGASSGMGLVYAERLAKRGYDLILVARRRERLDELAKRLGLETDRSVEMVVADLANAVDLSRVEKLLSEREDIDVLVNNAGVGALAPMKVVSADALENMIKINVVALTRLSHAVLPGFVRRNRGTIINLASIIAVIPSPAGAGYSGSKGYVLNFSRSLQMELAKTKPYFRARSEPSSLARRRLPSRTSCSCPQKKWSIPLSRRWTMASSSTSPRSSKNQLGPSSKLHGLR